MTLELESASYEAGGRMLVHGLRIAVVPGRVTVLAGPNGAGKSTALRLMSGDLRPAAGRVRLNDRSLGQWSAGEQALQRAVMMQHTRLDFPFPAADVVAMGRAAHRGSNRTANARIVRRALRLADATVLSERLYTTLSGGERQRVQFARALAQIIEPVPQGWSRFLLLDEPTASLDIAHQGTIMTVARALATEGIGVLAVLHDLNLAATFADELVLMQRGKIVAAGHPREVLKAGTIAAVYGTEVRVEHHAELDRVVILPLGPTRPHSPG
ncbi:MAG TPA: heme ABC transporter ATP-binding protein [Alphaproteobacteria bacterium]|nr:heme ABC transporter ATP-binding protein [Alphaproteobacteria bacterium]